MKNLTQFNHLALSAIENLILVTITMATVAAGGIEVVRMVSEMKQQLLYLILKLNSTNLSACNILIKHWNMNNCNTNLIFFHNDP